MTQDTQETAAKPQGERTIRKRRSATNPRKTNSSKVNRIKVALKRKHVPSPQKGEQGQRELPQQATISSIIGKRTRPSTQGRRRLQQPARKYHFEEAPLLHLSEAKASRRNPQKIGHTSDHNLSEDSPKRHKHTPKKRFTGTTKFQPTAGPDAPRKQ